MRKFYLLLYYMVARRLPKSTFPLIGKVAFRMRARCARHLFAECGEDVNLEQGAYIGNGKSIHAGSHVGIGKDFCVHGRTLIIRDYLMMGENVLVQGGGALLRRPGPAHRRRTRYTFRTPRDSRGCVDWSQGDYSPGLQAHWCA